MTTESTALLLALAMLYGVWLFIQGVKETGTALRSLLHSEPNIGTTISIVRGGRAFLTGGCLVALILGLLYDSTTAITMALVVGLEELYETTMALRLLYKIDAAGDQVFSRPARVHAD